MGVLSRSLARFGPRCAWPLPSYSETFSILLQCNTTTSTFDTFTLLLAIFFRERGSHLVATGWIDAINYIWHTHKNSLEQLPSLCVCRVSLIYYKFQSKSIRTFSVNTSHNDEKSLRWDKTCPLPERENF